MGFYENMGVKDIAALPGVSDLPIQVKSKFIQALKAEDTGDYAKAEEYLNQAIEKEEASKQEQPKK